MCVFFKIVFFFSKLGKKSPKYHESTEFVCSNTNEAFLLKYDFDCTSENVIYLITCKKCHAQYVGQTHQKKGFKENEQSSF